jgi:hypothetical protein
VTRAACQNILGLRQCRRVKKDKYRTRELPTSLGESMYTVKKINLQRLHSYEKNQALFKDLGQITIFARKILCVLYEYIFFFR